MEEIKKSTRNLRRLAVLAVNTFDETAVKGRSQAYNGSLAKLYEVMDEGLHAVEPNHKELDLRDLYGKLDEATLLLDSQLKPLRESNEYLLAFQEELLRLKVDILYYNDGD